MYCHSTILLILLTLKLCVIIVAHKPTWSIYLTHCDRSCVLMEV